MIYLLKVFAFIRIPVAFVCNLKTVSFIDFLNNFVMINKDE